MDSFQRSFSLNIGRVISSLILLLLAAITVPWAIYGDAMASFGPRNHHPNATKVILELIAITILPAIAIWIPSKIALILGGIILLIPTAIAVAVSWAVPQAAIVALPPLILWYICAVFSWKRLSV